MVEPGTCNGKVHTDDEIARLAKTPIFILFGDHLSSPTGLRGPSWEDRYNDCKACIQVARRCRQGRCSPHLTTVDAGFHGNSHMMMMDRNNLQIADLILTWIDEKTGRR